MENELFVILQAQRAEAARLSLAEAIREGAELQAWFEEVISLIEQN
ncbi:MAG: hypothetical protein Q8P23_00970 [bacterium]|nr:hypothetical protein [bacterium]